MSGSAVARRLLYSFRVRSLLWPYRSFRSLLDRYAVGSELDAEVTDPFSTASVHFIPSHRCLGFLCLWAIPHVCVRHG